MLDHFAILKGVVDGRQRKELVHALLRQVNLWPVRHRKLGTFSGGMRQRFGIAQALIGKPQLIIVDEPTAGLDPQERNRFLNLLAEVGEQVVVILSTHIVEDVTDLCPRMAIIAQGELRLTGEPREAIASLDGRVWKKMVDKAALDEHFAAHSVLSSRLVAGQPVIHVLSDDKPGEGFAAVPPDLEDVYFGELRRAAATDDAIAKAACAMLLHLLGFQLGHLLTTGVFWIVVAVYARLGFRTMTYGVVSIGVGVVQFLLHETEVVSSNQGQCCVLKIG